MQQALAESQELFRLFMDMVPAAAFIKDKDSTTVYFNRYMENIIGGRSWLGKSARDLFPSDVAEKMIADDLRSLEAGFVVTQEQVPGADGQTRLYETHKFCIPLQGKHPMLGGIALDITELKRIQVALATAKEEAEQASL